MKLIINDKRYAALKSLGEKKQCFNEYLQQRKKGEKEEERQRLKRAKEACSPPCVAVATLAHVKVSCHTVCFIKLSTRMLQHSMGTCDRFMVTAGVCHG